MMPLAWSEVTLIVGAYLLGSIPHLYLWGRLKGVDLSRCGSGNVGTINAYQMLGPLAGVVGGFGDAFKGAIPVLLGIYLGFDLVIIAAAGLAAIAGQMWPIFLKFKDGGRGMVTSFGVAGAIAPVASALVFSIGVIGMALPAISILLSQDVPLRERIRFIRPRTRSVPLGWLIAWASLPALSWYFGSWYIGSWYFDQSLTLALIFATVFFLLVLRRLTAGLRQDLARAGDKKVILINRLLYDRSQVQEEVAISESNNST